MKCTPTILACAALLALVLGAAPLQAQLSAPVSAPHPDDALLPEDLALLREHYRARQQAGDAARVVGKDQGGNELPARTVVLARGEHEPALVDVETRYRRALALYGGTLYHVPLPPAGGNEPGPRRPRFVAPEPAPVSSGIETTPWSVLAGLSVSVLLLVWYFVRVRPALIAPHELLEEVQATIEPASVPDEFLFRPTRRADKPKRFSLETPPSPLPQRPSGSASDARTTNPPPRR